MANHNNGDDDDQGRRGSVRCLTDSQFHSLVYAEYGQPLSPSSSSSSSTSSSNKKKTVICMHGLSRNKRDFSQLARRLAGQGQHVVAVDMPGRGESEWLTEKKLYGYPTYLSNLTTLTAKFTADATDKVDWIGTSMGGLAAMFIAANAAAPIRRLVLNDIGPAVSGASLRRLGTYVGKRTDDFADRAEALAYCQQHYQSMLPRGDAAAWQRFLDNTVEPVPSSSGSRYRLRYDPAIGNAIPPTDPPDVDLWETVWAKVDCEAILIVHGAESDILTAPTVERMMKTGPVAARKAVFAVTVRGVGHAPMLWSDAEAAVIGRFLVEGAQFKPVTASL